MVHLIRHLTGVHDTVHLSRKTASKTRQVSWHCAPASETMMLGMESKVKNVPKG